MDSYHKYKKFVIAVTLIGLVWAVVEFSGLLGRCTDSCGMEWVILFPILITLLLVLGIWTLVRFNKNNPDYNSKKYLLIIGTLVPLTYPIIDLKSHNLWGRHNYLDSDYVLFTLMAVILCLSFGAFLKGRIRLIVFYIFILIELLFLADMLL